MRGKQLTALLTGYILGITPADAGKTLCNPSVASLMIGSPPRMRGKHQHLYRLMRALRITPADAGKTVNTAESRNAETDHPRGCGENYQPLH